MWAFAIWDVRERRLFCARDRFGVKPFYYYLTEDTFIFSSEIKQILEYKDYRRKPNEKLIYDYLVIGIEDHTEESFFENIFQLRSGEYAILDYGAKNFKKERYYDLRIDHGVMSYEKDYYECFKNLFFEAVKIRLRSDVPLGSCLSGGLDSSAVVCAISEIWSDRQSGIPVETFTVCWENIKIDERKYSEEVVDFTGTHGNNIFPTSEELQEDLSKLIWHQEEPFASLSIFAQWSVMKAARHKGIPVLLDGQGGDEVFLGYERYYAWFLMDLVKQFKFAKTIREIRKGSQHSKLSLAEIIQYYFYFNFNHVRAFRLGNKANKYMNTDFMQNYNLLDRLNDIFEKAKNIVALQHTEIHTTQLSHLLKYADRNSMAFSIESRLPFLDYRLIEFALSVPSELKIRDGWTKNLVREGMKGIIPDSIRKRKNKIGFEVPQDVLIKTILPEIQTKLEKSTIIRKYFNEKWLLSMIRTKKLNDINVWKALCLELWFREFFG
jgi:asparagine synthase (glutamine-hydrolysing)